MLPVLEMLDASGGVLPPSYQESNDGDSTADDQQHADFATSSQAWEAASEMIFTKCTPTTSNKRKLGALLGLGSTSQQQAAAMGAGGEHSSTTPGSGEATTSSASTTTVLTPASSGHGPKRGRSSGGLLSHLISHHSSSSSHSTSGSNSSMGGSNISHSGEMSVGEVSSTHDS
jgi:hypothetical protein